MGDNQRDTKSCMGNSGQQVQAAREVGSLTLGFNRTYGCSQCEATTTGLASGDGWWLVGDKLFCPRCAGLSKAEPTDLSDPAQLRKLLLDEWRYSCPIFGGDPELLEAMEKPPWNRSLPQLVLLAVQSWWAYDVEQTPGMWAIAAYVRGD